MFEQMLLPRGHAHQGRCAVFALAGELGLMALASVLVVWSDAIPMKLPETAVSLVFSPPPPPPAAPAVRAPARTAATRVLPRTFVAPVLVAPQTIPQHALILANAEPPLPEMGSAGGVIGGVPGGVPGGALDGLLASLPPPPPVAPKSQPAPAAAPPPPAQIRVGGAVEEALLTHQVAPLYPPLAKRSRIEGTVEMSAVIAPDGTVKNLRVLSGNPLLVEAARNAVMQWIYRPTYLNGHAMEVLTEIAVKFRLV